MWVNEVYFLTFYKCGFISLFNKDSHYKLKLRWDIAHINISWTILSTSVGWYQLYCENTALHNKIWKKNNDCLMLTHVSLEHIATHVYGSMQEQMKKKKLSHQWSERKRRQVFFCIADTVNAWWMSAKEVSFEVRPGVETFVIYYVGWPRSQLRRRYPLH